MWFKRKKTVVKIDDFLIRHHLKRQPRANRLKWLLIFLLGFCLIFLVVVLPLLVSAIKIIQESKQIKEKVNLTAVLVKNGDWHKVSEELLAIEGDISKIKSYLKGLGPILFWPEIKKTTAASDQILTASAKLFSGYSEAFGLLAKIEADFKIEDLSLGFSDSNQRIKLLGLIRDSRQTLMAIKNQIDEAKLAINQADLTQAAKWWPSQFYLIDYFLQAAVDHTEIALPIFSNLPELLGDNQSKRYLFIFQNNTEIRPTGGFIGSYGIFTVKNGELTNFFTDDVYNLDKLSESKLKVLAPEPMQKYNSQKYWYLRDANWSPDWPTSAEQIIWFFNIESANAGLPPKELDGVITITPDFIANILGVIGSIKVRGITFSAANFTKELEQFVEFDYPQYGLKKSERKAIIGELTEAIINKLYNLPANDWLTVWLAFKKNIEEKHILVYLLDKKLQESFFEKNWAGKVQETAGDYLLVIDSNLASLKTDQVMKKSINYNLKIDESGDLIAQLEITYQHEGNYKKDLITRYRDYLRFYVPDGSWFLKSYLKEGGQTTELAILKDLEVHQELAKRVAATFLVVEPQTEKTLVVTYRLPQKIKEQYQRGMYKFSVQKQAGTIGHDLKINLNFNQDISAYQSDNLPQSFKSKAISWETDLKVDREFIVKF